MPLSQTKYDQIDRLIREGMYNNEQIGRICGVSSTTVRGRRKAREDEMTPIIQKITGTEPLVYRGGGEW